MPGKLRQSENNVVYIGKESVFGTAITPTTFIRVKQGAEANVKRDYIQSKSLIGSRLNPGKFLSTQLVEMKLPCEFDGHNLQAVLQGLLGQESVSGVGPYVHTFTPLNSANLPSYSVQMGYGAYKYYGYNGSIFNTLTLDIQPKALVEGDVGVVALAETDLSIQVSGVSATTITTATAHGYAVGDAVRFFLTSTDGQTTGTMPSGMSPDTVYYVVTGSTGSTLEVSDTSGGSAISFGTGFLAGIEVVRTAINGLTVPNFRPFAFQDVSVKVNGNVLNEFQNLKLNFTNNAFTSDFRTGLAGQLASIPAGQLVTTITFSVPMDEYTMFLKDAWALGEEIALEIDALSNVPITGGYMGFSVVCPTVQITDAKITGTQIGVQITADVVGTFSATVSNDVSAVFS